MDDKQHIIPKLHLNYFVDQRGQVWTYEKDGRKRSALPENTAKENHFYSYNAPDGTMRSEMDKYLQSVEHNAGIPYRTLVETGNVDALTPQQKADMATFVATLTFRTRGAREAVSESYARMITAENLAVANDDERFTSTMEKYERDRGALPEEERQKLRENLKDPNAFTMLVPKEHSLIAMEGADKMMIALHGMHWCIGDVKQGFLITSDHPVTQLIHPNTATVKGQYLNKTAQVTFPLTKDRLLIMTYGRIRKRIELLRQHVDEENNHRITMAYNEIYSHCDDKRLERSARDINKGPRLNSPTTPAPTFKTPRKWDWEKENQTSKKGDAT